MTISRSTLPAEFFDITSDMLLLQPEPQYFHGALIKGAMAASLAEPGDVGIAGRLMGGSGAPYANAADSRLLLEQRAMASEAVQFVTELGKAPGHTVRMNRPVFANTTYTEASRTIPVGTTISTTPITVSSEQVAITLQRFGGPYDSDNSVVAPIGIDKFDASVALHKLVSVRGMHLVRDFDRFIDAVGVALFGNTSSTLYPTGMSTDNTPAVAGDYPFDYELLTRIERTLDEANIPMFANGKRKLVVHPRQLAQLKNDSQFQRLAVFNTSQNPLTTSYVGECGNLDIYKSNTLATASNSNSITIYRAQAFGPGMVGVGLGRKPEAVASSADNYGENSLAIWLMYAGFVTLDSRFGVTVTTS